MSAALSGIIHCTFRIFIGEMALSQSVVLGRESSNTHLCANVQNKHLIA